MIGSLRGTLRSKQPPWVLLEVAGVGYEVETPMSTFFALPEVGAETALLTHLLVRQDVQQLYGFASEEERSLFRHLLKVSGVGARMALAILSGISVDGFRRCVVNDDATSLTKVPGVGKKTAARLVVEMRDRIAGDGADAALAGGTPLERGPRGEAVAALVALGYKSAEVERLLGSIDTEGAGAEDIIRRALRRAAG